jgi:putative hemolysin
MAKRTSLFYAQVGRTDAGSFRITVRARNPKDQYSRHRELAVCVYKLAAEMERRSAKIGAAWVVSAQVFNSRIDLELTERDDEQAAGRFVAKVLADLGLS